MESGKLRKMGKFEKAMRSSLNNLIKQGNKFSVEEVIEGAYFDNGKPVGKTTLHKKGSDGQFAYKDLKIDISNAQTDAGVKIKGGEGELALLQEEKNELEDLSLQQENRLAVLVDTILEQEAEIRRLKRMSGSEENVLRRFELELFITNMLLLDRLPKESDAYKKAKKQVENVELKYRGTDIMQSLKTELDNLRKNISYYTFTDISSVK